MSVYVDDAIWEWRNRKWCHMAADTVEELHEFARKIDLKRCWFQGGKRYWHYDITEARRARAIAAGALPVSSRELLAACKRMMHAAVVKKSQIELPV